MSKAVVLISYYNGEKFILDQIQSLIEQSFDNIDIILRNDGSTSSCTEDILFKIQRLYTSVKVISGKNIGVVKSFFELLKFADGYDYYFFCDQDDVWMHTKVERAVQFLNTTNNPALYCGSYVLVDHSLNVLSRKESIVIPSFENALFKNFCTGCTCAMNSKLRDVILDTDTFDHLPMHDWWCLLVGYLCGDVFYDESPQIFYRQHSGNVVGGVVTFKEKLTRFVHHIFQGNDSRFNMMLKLSSNFSNKNSEYCKTLHRLIFCKSTLITRLVFSLNIRLSYKNFLDRLSVRVLIALGKY